MYLPNYTNKDYRKLVKSKVLYLFILMIIDYILTYIGINKLEFIIEANHTLIWLFELPFLYGLLLRVAMSVFLCSLFQVVYIVEHKCYNSLINFALLVNIFILMLHFDWMIKYLMLVVS